MTIPVIVVAGPTGSGKTDTAVILAELLHGEVITADSMQVYRRMDIGTAKPTLAERRGVPHHLIDLVEPDVDFSVSEYVKLADKVIADLHAVGKVPIISGGTGFYINALLDRWTFPPRPVDELFRQEMRIIAENDGAKALHDKLAIIDPVTAERLHVNDIKRVIRALEVYELTGKRLSEFHYKPGETSDAVLPYQPFYFGLTLPRDILYQRLENRVQEQLAAGLLEEVASLLENGYHAELPSMLGITYRQLAGYLQGKYDFPTAVELMVRDNRRYAKRQYTWFNADKRIRWIDIIETGGSAQAAKIIIESWQHFLENNGFFAILGD